MAEWAIKNWVRGEERTKIWAVQPVDTRAVLPLIDEAGRWEEFRRVEPHRFPEIEDAQDAIATDGFYFVRERTAIGPLLPLKG